MNPSKIANTFAGERQMIYSNKTISNHIDYLADIHRNSFLYRINKIEEITGVDLREYHTFIHLAINIYIEEI